MNGERAQRYYDEDENLGDERKGPYVGGQRHGAWVRLRYAERDDATHGYYERQEGAYAENEKHGS